MKLEEYFELPYTPTAGSPVGMLMARVVEKNPRIDFESAKAEGQALLQQAASRNRHQIPNALSLADKAEAAARTKARFLALRAVA